MIGLAVEDALAIIDEGRYKLAVYGCERVIIIHRWRAYMVANEGPLLVVRDDINRVICVSGEVSPRISGF